MLMTRAFVLLAAAACASLVLGGTAAAKTYYAKVGPGMTITVKNARGVKVSQIPRGRHTIRVRDRSMQHNFHLLGPEVNRKTTLAFVGLKIWTIRFVPGAYRYRCDPHRLHMRGRFTVA
jgi:plastocyanin